MGKTTSFVAAAMLATGLWASTGATAFAKGPSNPVDRVSNPRAFDYPNAEIGVRDMKELFVRDGIVTEPQLFATVKAGLTQTELRSMLGEPLRQQGARWDYNFRLKMPHSENFLVCQYKVVFDEQQLVRDTVWRRRQCQQLAGN